MRTDYKIGMLFGQTVVFAGYSFMVFGFIGAFFNLTGLILVVAGMFMALTYEGTNIDYDSRKIRSYTCLFGLFKTGRWHNVDRFNRFKIYRSKRSSTTYSRGNVPLTLKSSDIRLALLNENGKLRIIINYYDSFESARNEMSELIRDLKMTKMEEWRKFYGPAELNPRN